MDLIIIIIIILSIEFDYFPYEVNYNKLKDQY